jgi:hypothetical protein
MPERGRIRSYEQLFCLAWRPAAVRALPPGVRTTPGQERTREPVPGQREFQAGHRPGQHSRTGTAGARHAVGARSAGCYPRHVISGGSAVLEPT